MNKLTFASVLALTLGLSLPAAAQPDLNGLTSRCCGGSCCTIPEGDSCQDSGEAMPGNPCLVCDVSQSITEWTDICVDAGPEVDAGPVAVDAGPIAVDAGPAGTDAGPTGGTDAGPTGGIDAGPEAGGGGCSVAQRDSQAFGALLAIAAIGLLFRRRQS